MPESPSTLEELIEKRRGRDLPTEVFVTGVRNHYPEDVASTARRVAELIAIDNGAVLERDFDELSPNDVALVEISTGPTRGTYKDLEELRELASVARASSYNEIVGYGSGFDLPKRVLHVLDARVEVDEDGAELVHQVKQVNPYEGNVVLAQLDGIEG